MWRMRFPVARTSVWGFHNLGWRASSGYADGPPQPVKSVLLEPGGCGKEPQPRRRGVSDILFLNAGSPFRLNASFFVPRGWPAFPLFAILRFHSRTKLSISQCAFISCEYSRLETGGQNAAASAKDRRAFAKTPRPDDPRGSRHDGGRSETRPRVKLDYRATAPRS
jgi:hypothetical protein